MSSSSSDDEETEATERCKLLPGEESNAMVDKLISPTGQSVRPKLRGECSYSGVSDTVAETRAVTLTEPLRKSDGGREDDFKSDSDDDTQATKRRDYDESGGGREDGLIWVVTTSPLVIEYIGGTNYVALTREARTRALRKGKFCCARKQTILNVFAQLSQDLGFQGLSGMVTTGGVIYHRKPLQTAGIERLHVSNHWIRSPILRSHRSIL